MTRFQMGSQGQNVTLCILGNTIQQIPNCVLSLLLSHVHRPDSGPSPAADANSAGLRQGLPLCISTPRPGWVRLHVGIIINFVRCDHGIVVGYESVIFYHEMQTDTLRLKCQDDNHVLSNSPRPTGNTAEGNDLNLGVGCEEVCFIGLLFRMLEIFIKKRKAFQAAPRCSRG